jgi:hypothetical protein
MLIACVLTGFASQGAIKTDRATCRPSKYLGHILGFFSHINGCNSMLFLFWMILPD